MKNLFTFRNSLVLSLIVSVLIALLYQADSLTVLATAGIGVLTFFSSLVQQHPYREMSVLLFSAGALFSTLIIGTFLISFFAPEIREVLLFDSRILASGGTASFVIGITYVLRKNREKKIEYENRILRT